ncbi:M81 family metallopeptidase [Desertibaculum subflavum]|uniref:M81 family metallopeptidase n=1 Tax=Desertibaculum subflavum TaxID=2268458 RepID=UPI000E660917
MTRRVLIASVMHETNTFSRLPTDLEAFRHRYLHRGEAVPANFRGTSTEIGGFLEIAAREGWQVAHPIAAAATPSGKVTGEAWAVLSGEIVEAARPRPDGILLALHGAMVTETVDDAEGDLLERLRATVGNDVPIAITLDLHANVTDRMARLADIIIPYRTYPHVDQVERARQAAELVARAMAGEIRPQTVVARRPTLDGMDHGRTTSEGPMRALLARAAAFEREPGVLVVGLNAGFGWADIAEAGPSVTVTGDGNSPRWRAIADELMDEVWQTRTQSTATLLPVADAVARARQMGKPGKPAVLADTTDNPGGGGYGDATRLLAGMINAGLQNAAYCPITDPAAVAACRQAGLGARLSLAIGGQVDPAFGPPLGVEGTVRFLGDGAFTFDGPMWKGLKGTMGEIAVLAVGGVEIVLASNRFQVTDPQHFLAAGIDPRAKSVIGLKSSQHFRAAYQPIASEVLLVNSGALTNPDYRMFTYRKLRRPIWPLDDVTA